MENVAELNTVALEQGDAFLKSYLIADGYTRTMPRRIAPSERIKAVQDFFRAADYVGV